MINKAHLARNMIENTFVILEQSIDKCSEDVIDYAYSLGRREEYLTDKDHTKFDSLAKKFYKKCQCNINK